jgi:glycosyltransferase involved in cell wall biosynthesis
MEVNPKVTVIVPTYNRAHLLKETIESVLNQTFQDYEILIVDDGSTDKTKEVVESFQIDKIRYIYKKHSGAPETRNKGIENAKGDFIVWLDSDDTLTPNALELTFKEFEKDKTLHVVYGDLDQFYSDLKTFYRHVSYPSLTRKELIGRLIWGMPICLCGTMIKKICYKEVGKYDPFFKRAHDYEFWTRLASKENLKLKHIPYTLYRQRGTGPPPGEKPHKTISGFNPDRKYEAEIVRRLLKRYSLEELFPQLSTLPPNQRNALAFLNIGKIFMNWEAYKDAISYLKKCLKIILIPEAYKLLSLCYEKLGEPKEANFYKEMAMRLGTLF